MLARLAPGRARRRRTRSSSATAGRSRAGASRDVQGIQGWRLAATPWAAALLQDVRPAAFDAARRRRRSCCSSPAPTSRTWCWRDRRRGSASSRCGLRSAPARWRLARHLLTESLLLAFAGGGRGLGLAYVGLKFADAIIPAQFAMLGSAGGPQRARADLESRAVVGVRPAGRTRFPRCSGDPNRSARLAEG